MINSRVKTKVNRPPVKPVKLLEVPLTFWYIGPYPLDSTQPIRALPPLRYRPTPKDAGEGPDPIPDKDGRRVEIITTTPPPLVMLDPPGGMPGSMILQPETETSGSARKQKSKAKAGGVVADATADEVAQPFQVATPDQSLSTDKEKKKKKRKSAMPLSTPIGEDTVGTASPGGAELASDAIVTPVSKKKKKITNTNGVKDSNGDAVLMTGGMESALDTLATEAMDVLETSPSRLVGGGKAKKAARKSKG